MGTIPDDITKFSSLRSLILRSNYLEGPIPDITVLDGLKSVDFRWNEYLTITDNLKLRQFINDRKVSVEDIEDEWEKGFSDLWLDPFMEKYPDLEYSYLIELKYAKRGEFSEDKQRELSAKAKGQLMRYAADERVIRRSRGTTLKCIGLIFSG